MDYVSKVKSANGRIWRSCNDAKIESRTFFDFSVLPSKPFLKKVTILTAGSRNAVTGNFFADLSRRDAAFLAFHAVKCGSEHFLIKISKNDLGF